MQSAIECNRLTKQCNMRCNLWYKVTRWQYNQRDNLIYDTMRSTCTETMDVYLSGFPCIYVVPKITVNDWFSALEPTPSSETFLFSEPSAAKCHLSFLSFSQDCSLLSALWVPRTGSASDWCAVRLALYKMNIIISLQLYPISPFQAFWCLMKHASAALLPPLSDLTGNWTCASTGHRLLTNPSDMTQRSQQR